MLPPTIPLFPLPNVVLFPNVFLPLHVFEPRYRAMIGDALEGDRIVGMVLLQPGYQADYAGRPPVFPIGCAGLITRAEPLADGRYNVILRGLERFRIEREDADKPYRVAHVSGLPEIILDEHRAELRRYRHRIEALLVAALERTGAKPRFPPAVPDDDLINGLAQHLELDALERQALLEREGVLDRCRGLIELLEMKKISTRTSWKGGTVH